MQNKTVFIFIALLLGVVFWRWWLPEVKVANDFPIVSGTTLKSLVEFPSSWTDRGAEGLGEYTIFTLWSWPLTFLSGVISYLDLNFSILERILFIIPLLLFGTIGIWKISEDLKLANHSKVISTFFYLTNSYILMLVDGGQLSIALAYGLLPISLLAVLKAISGSVSKKILAALSVWLLGVFDIRFIYVFFILLFLRFLYELFFLNKREAVRWFLRWLTTGSLVGLFFLGFNSYWLLPILKSPIQSTIYTQFTALTSSGIPSLGHSVLMLSPHWFANVFGRITPLRAEFIFIPILVFLAPILKPKSKVVGFWLLMAVVSIFLTKGISNPLGSAYFWLYSNIPGFSLFRDSTKFFVIQTLAYSLLIGVSVDEIAKRLKAFKFKLVFLTLVIAYFIFLARPVIFGWTTGTFSDQPLQQEFSKMANYLRSDKNFSRVFWIKATHPLGYSDSQHPIVEASRLVKRRPFAIGNRGTYEVFNFLREAPFTGELFDVAGIGYIAYPYLDPEKDDIHPDNIRYYYTFLDQLSKLPWIEGVVKQSPIPLLKTKQHQDKFFVAQNVWWVIGSDDIYSESVKNGLKFANNAFIFAEENPGSSKRLDQLPQAKIILNKKTKMDLATSFIEEEDLIFPARSLEVHPNQGGWWKREAVDLFWLRDFLQIKYGIDNQAFDLGGGWAIAEGYLKLEIINEKLQKNNILLARVMESTKAGTLKFYSDNKLVGQISTLKEGNNVRWFEVGLLNEDGKLLIESNGDINIVNGLATLSKNEWQSMQEKANSLIKQNRLATLKDAKDVKSVKVDYQQINPTKYKVTVQNLNQPGLLIFSQTLDSLWKINGQYAFPVYSLVNGFPIEKDGQYLVEFEPQKHIYQGLAISLATLLLTVVLLKKYT